jgi:hypothetical protein
MNQTIATQPSKSLSWTLTKSSLIAVVIGMATYTFFEILTSGEVDTQELVTHHLLPTILIGVIIWGVLTMLLRSKVINPVHDILDHLTHVGNGRFAPLEKLNEITKPSETSLIEVLSFTKCFISSRVTPPSTAAMHISRSSSASDRSLSAPTDIAMAFSLARAKDFFWHL